MTIDIARSKENVRWEFSTVICEKPVYRVNYTDSISWAEYPFEDRDGFSENEGVGIPKVPISSYSFEPIRKND